MLDTCLFRAHSYYNYNNKTDFDGCVASRNCLEKMLSYEMPQFAWFCGHGPFNGREKNECWRPTEQSLNMAKFNVETSFSAVGILEDLKTTFSVYEGMTIAIGL